jgi:cation diffusion facilitator family transporter
MINQRHSVIKRVTYVGILVNILLSGAQIVSGLLAHSQALIADGIHTLADLLSDFVVLFAAQHAAKAADEDHPYGHGRFETLTSIFLGIALVAVALGIGYRGILSIADPSPQSVEPYALFFAFLAIVSKEFLYRYTIKAAREIKSTLLESNALHHRSDVFSSIVVVAGVGAQIFGVPHMDALAAIIVAVMISLMGLHLVKKSFAELIDTSLDQELLDKIKQHLLNTSGVVAVHSLRSRSMGGLGYIDTEIRVNPRLSVSEAHYISLHLEQSVKKTFNEIADITVHIDPVSDIDHESILKLPPRSELLFSLFSAWESIEGSDKILNIHLHYLGNQVEIDIFLPINMACDKDYSLSDNLIGAAKRLNFIGKINTYYAQ